MTFLETWDEENTNTFEGYEYEYYRCKMFTDRTRFGIITMVYRIREVNHQYRKNLWNL